MYRVSSVLLCLSLAAFATTLKQMSVDQMTSAATSIVRATVTGSTATRAGSIIYTHYAIQVAETLKGPTPTDVALPGGVASGYRQSFPGVPQLRTGTQYLLFLWKSPTTGITQVVGYSLGVFNINTQPDGSLMASRPPVGETILDVNGKTVPDRGANISISGLRASIQGAAQ